MLRSLRSSDQNSESHALLHEERESRKGWFSFLVGKISKAKKTDDKKADIFSLPPEIINLMINPRDNPKEVAMLAATNKRMNDIVKNTCRTATGETYGVILAGLRKDYIVNRVNKINADMVWVEARLEQLRDKAEGNEMCHSCAYCTTGGCTICCAGVGGGLAYATGIGALGGGLAFLAGAGIGASLPIGFFLMCSLIGWGYQACDERDVGTLQKEWNQLFMDKQNYNNQLDLLNAEQEQLEKEDEEQSKGMRLS